MASNDKNSHAVVPSDDELPPPGPVHPDSLTAKCHCGRVNVEIPDLPTKLNECRCSICYRYGAVWAYYHPDQVNIIVNTQVSRSAPAGATTQGESRQAGENDKGLQYYVRDDSDGYLGFYFCGNCGCLTHWAATEAGLAWLDKEGHPKKVGVNSRMLQPNLLNGVEKKTGPFCELSEWD
jgi:hypothetical protein